MSVIELKPIYVYTSRPNTPFFYSWGAPSSLYYEWAQQYDPETDPGAVILDYWTGETPVLETLNGLKGGSQEQINATLLGIAEADLSATRLQNIPYALVSDQPPSSYDAQDNVFAGSNTTPIAALAHYIWGNGETMSVDISNALNVVNAERVAPLNALINDKAVVGSVSVATDVAYDTANSDVFAAAYLGNITMRVEGTFTRYSENSWSFDGEIRAYNDIYDANPSNHRGVIAEASTWILGSTPGTPYEIEITGSMQVHYDQGNLWGMPQ